VSHKATSLHAVLLGYGYAWFPEDAIRASSQRGALRPMPLREGAERRAASISSSPTATPPARARFASPTSFARR
jgi:DNA-binding transcriptional LysR family regulator